MKPRTVYETPRKAGAPGEEVVTSTCAHNCGGRCVVNAHVKDGQIVRISTDPRRWTPEMPPLTACVRGFGAAERVSWDEALDEVAAQMLRIRDTYGPAAILDCSRTGSTAVIHNRAVVQRLLHLFGGCTELWSNLSN